MTVWYIGKILKSDFSSHSLPFAENRLLQCKQANSNVFSAAENMMSAII